MRTMGSTCRSALQELDWERAERLERVQNVLLVTNYLFLGTQISGSVKEAIRKFDTTRHLSGHPVAVQWL